MDAPGVKRISDTIESATTLQELEVMRIQFEKGARETNAAAMTMLKEHRQAGIQIRKLFVTKRALLKQSLSRKQ